MEFISLEVLKNAFLKGIDSFIELYNIQNNKNIISSTLGNTAINIGKLKNFSKGNFVHTNEITVSEITKANNLKAAINRSDEKELKIIFKNFGVKLDDIQKSQSKEAFISSMYSFICLSIFFNASVSLDIPIDLNDLLKCYLTPDTRHKKLMNLISHSVALSLKDLENFVIDQRLVDSFATFSETDKLWACLCQTNPTITKKILGEETFDEYKSILNKILQSSTHRIEVRNMPCFNFSKDEINSIKESYEIFKYSLTCINNIAIGIEAYVLKFIQHTENPSMKKQVANYAADEAKQFGAGMGWAAMPLYNHILNLMGGDSPSSQALQTLQRFLPPALIAQLISSVTTTLVSLAFQSKSYGFINRHGITGQIRSFLLRNFLEMFAAFISNNFHNLLLQNNINDINEHKTKFLDNIDNFMQVFKSSIEKNLPNKQKMGSLYYYLKMYADPDKEFSRNEDLIAAWNKSKIKIDTSIE